MMWLGPALLMTVAAACGGIELVTAETTWRALLAVVFAGALGATFSAGLYSCAKSALEWSAYGCFGPPGSFKLRLSARIGRVHLCGAQKWIHFGVGLTGPTWAIEATFAFVAGASEPLVLRTVEGVAGLGDLDADPSSKTGVD